MTRHRQLRYDGVQGADAIRAHPKSATAALRHAFAEHSSPRRILVDDLLPAAMATILYRSWRR